jgi:hypothetical protein
MCGAVFLSMVNVFLPESDSSNKPFEDKVFNCNYSAPPKRIISTEE